jgi:predicted TIM-barrel fold metal-dependent hydrolase
MEADGVAAEVIFHGSQNGNPLPFGFGGTGDFELEAVGLRIYNRWLGDFCSAYPDQRVGLMQLPAWSPEACVEEIRASCADGLRGVNLPAIRPSEQTRPLYTNSRWEPVWDICQTLDLPLANHSAPELGTLRDPCTGSLAIMSAELGWLARRTTWWLIYSGVFDRYPGLRFVITENPGDWPRTELPDLDSGYRLSNIDGRLGKEVAHEPSWYFHHNIWLTGSFLSNREVRMYLDLGLGDRLMWGSDYPHIEGTWPNTTAALRKTFEGIGPDSIRRILSGNAIDAFGFDAQKLTDVAGRVGPTVAAVSQPLTTVPEGLEFSLAFREFAAFA